MNKETPLLTQINSLIRQQLAEWPMVTLNYEGLKQVKSRSLFFGEGVEVKIQVNPERIRSSAARIDPQSILARPCFLCQKNRPNEQRWVPFGERYQVMVNPFPIFPRHLTITDRSHVPQRIDARVGDMMLLARALPGYVVFYNGPMCGASAPDHFHFQAGNRDFLPVEQVFESPRGRRKVLVERSSMSISVMESWLPKNLVIEGDRTEEIEEWFYRIYDSLALIQHDEEEPMMNILCSYLDDRWRLTVFPRKQHRPRQYYAEGKAKVLWSPASVDFGGVAVIPRMEDYDKMNHELVTDVFDQITLDHQTWQELMRTFPSATK